MGAFGHEMTKGVARLLRWVLRALRIFSWANYGDMTREVLFEELFAQWGCLLGGKQGVCPVWLSEFGSGEDPSSYDMKWLHKILQYIESVDADWAYWPLNVGNKPGTSDNESYGMLSSKWTPKPEGDIRLNLFREHGLLPKPHT